MSAILVSLAIITGFVSVDTCSAFAIDALVCLDNTLGQGFSSSGRQTCMELPCIVPDCLGGYCDTDPLGVI